MLYKINCNAIENTLFISIIKSDKKAFNKLFLSHYKELCRFAITFMNDTDESEEVVQKVFIRIWENRKTLTCPDNPKSFLFKSVYNECLNSIRNNNTRLKNKLNYVLQLKSDVEMENLDNNPEIYNRLNKAIENLPEKCRQIFILNKIERLTQQEIADYLDISNKTVENQTANAISKLRVELKPVLHLLPGYILLFL